MFNVNDMLVYIPGGVEVQVVEVHDRHMIVKDVEENWILDPVYEDEYNEYELLTSSTD